MMSRARGSGKTNKAEMKVGSLHCRETHQKILPSKCCIPVTVLIRTWAGTTWTASVQLEAHPPRDWPHGLCLLGLQDPFNPPSMRGPERVHEPGAGETGTSGDPRVSAERSLQVIAQRVLCRRCSLRGVLDPSFSQVVQDCQTCQSVHGFCDAQGLGIKISFTDSKTLS